MNIQELEANCDDAAELLRALANPHRLLILCELTDGERSVSELEAVVPLSQSALSQHLAKLREGKFVATRRDAQSIYYSLADARVARLIGLLHELFCTASKPRARGRSI
ncbi:MAG: metalloregulator ArsR/SmtB family transcription factor [Hyphomicrobium sp.]|nr:metalloregulator ArsR/SmtB family transcription factor [Hyphomicrobium sp.]KAB2940001.1 MAG: helix-turn-helix transcriptional regulator [Hyphomicrobium sp.]MBZ0209920.1 metalloregulator ArsR/SmtB family transcription factor [Hyphomicrobium sp.]